jgi:hypothetical protein
MNPIVQGSTGRAIIQLTESGENSISAVSIHCFSFIISNLHILQTVLTSPIQGHESRIFAATHIIKPLNLHPPPSAERDPVRVYPSISVICQITCPGEIDDYDL